MKKILIIDTSILCVYLKIPGKEECGAVGNKWDYEKISKKIEDEIACGSTLVLPLATIIETGNHIAYLCSSRTGGSKVFSLATDLAGIMKKVANAESPWAAFMGQFHRQEFDNRWLTELAEEWPDLAKSGLSLADATIRKVAELYSGFCEVEILTGDTRLKSYEPKVAVDIPRRRQKK
ncbi:MAG: hypothetical protein IJ523_10915 [Succinivibrionaceae bacterium]|nr:hypothetical protein [Succinivibrionaceae bacterium]